MEITSSLRPVYTSVKGLLHYLLRLMCAEGGRLDVPPDQCFVTCSYPKSHRHSPKQRGAYTAAVTRLVSCRWRIGLMDDTQQVINQWERPVPCLLKDVITLIGYDRNNKTINRISWRTASLLLRAGLKGAALTRCYLRNTEIRPTPSPFNSPDRRPRCPVPTWARIPTPRKS